MLPKKEKEESASFPGGATEPGFRKPPPKVTRVFSEATYNGYRVVSLSDAPTVGLKIAKQLRERDGMGNLFDPSDLPNCPHPGYVNTAVTPWGGINLVPTTCLKCKWLYGTPSKANHDCFLKRMDPIVNPEDLVTGTA